MKPTPTIGDIRYLSRNIFELLGLGPDEGVTDDFATYGWSIVDSLALSDIAGKIEPLSDPVLVLALHSSDEPQARDQVELEFVLNEEAESPTSLVFPISTFFTSILEPLLSRQHNVPSNVVMALCNPLKLDIPCPTSLAHKHVYFAKGDVEAWLDWPNRKNQRIRLHSESWHKSSTKE